ncbi:mevalonate kinase [Candidatus Micrarchaeota archaeon]|nr:mevalonate kinase [Candidatus Micrarchaeota archaeon]
MGKGSGHGKIIIFGEHFVVHGAPAIAAGISNTANVEVIKAAKNSIVTKQRVIPDLSIAAIANVLSAMNIKESYEVRLTGDLPTEGGLGSSAAFCVGLVRALADEKKLHLTPEQVNRFAYEGEKTFHGNPSGIDNYIATHRGVLEFTRGRTPLENKFVPLELERPLDFVVSLTGKIGSTPKMIENVRKFKEADPEEFGQLMDEYFKIATEGAKFISKGKLDEIGSLMNANQSLLSELGVSDERNDAVVETAMKEGAYGAKLTGGGGGGSCIALAKDKAHAEKLAQALTKAGYASFSTVIDRK